MDAGNIILWILLFFMGLIIPCCVIIKIHYYDNNQNQLETP